MNNNEIIKKLQIKNEKLQVQIERLKLDKEDYYLEYLDLQDRIDKAIEYIEDNNNYEEGYCDGELMTYKRNLKDLLDILRGEEDGKDS